MSERNRCCNAAIFRPQFGDSQKLRLVRILRSTVMVRVGGGWVALDEFLVKNDPCRGMYTVCRTQLRSHFLPKPTKNTQHIYSITQSTMPKRLYYISVKISNIAPPKGNGHLTYTQQNPSIVYLSFIHWKRKQNNNINPKKIV